MRGVRNDNLDNLSLIAVASIKFRKPLMPPMLKNQVDSFDLFSPSKISGDLIAKNAGTMFRIKQHSYF